VVVNARESGKPVVKNLRFAGAVDKSPQKPDAAIERLCLVVPGVGRSAARGVTPRDWRERTELAMSASVTVEEKRHVESPCWRPTQT
jgi:hypothetical protein